MPRRSRRRPYSQAHRELDAATVFKGIERTEVGPDGLTWTVRSTSGSAKTYTCPGCGRPIPPSAEHLVAWTPDHIFGAQAGLGERRHWHTSCWRARR